MKNTMVLVLEKELKKILSNMKNEKYSYNEKLDLIINNETKKGIGNVRSLALFVMELV